MVWALAPPGASLRAPLSLACPFPTLYTWSSPGRNPLRSAFNPRGGRKQMHPDQEAVIHEPVVGQELGVSLQLLPHGRMLRDGNSRKAQREPVLILELSRLLPKVPGEVDHPTKPVARAHSPQEAPVLQRQRMAARRRAFEVKDQSREGRLARGASSLRHLRRGKHVLQHQEMPHRDALLLVVLPPL
eukprot:scaffold336_cov250-Pinguiococcus_pyrenoidosus.AAC.9